MDDLVNLLCPNTDMKEIIALSEQIENRLKQQSTPGSLYTDSEDNRWLMCMDCGTGEMEFIRDDSSGDVICPGCGRVQLDHFLVPDSSEHQVVEAQAHLYSEQKHFQSRLVYRGKEFKKVNHQMERRLNLLGKDYLTTSDFYRDCQRDQVYETLDSVSGELGIDDSVTESVKLLFHKYRKEMIRIHKLPRVLCALFYLVL